MLAGEPGLPPACPRGAHRLVRNGSFVRLAEDGRGIYSLRIQRYLCRSCAVTYSALPYDCRPYTASTWAITTAVGWIWREEHQWTWQACHDWLKAHQIDHHQRTLERWASRWRAGRPTLIQRAIQWIGQVWGTRAVPVWPEPDRTLLQHWRQLWRQIVHRAPPAGRGGVLAGSVLWGWLPITFFAGLSE